MNYLDICNNLNLETLRGADLRDADLYGADLRGADLRGADLRDADLYGADLYNANLRCANLRRANLRNTDLRGADLYNADLRGADLYNADLRGADLYNANLCNANLTVIYGEQYFISICKEVVRAGCQSHTVEEWRTFSKTQVINMDGRKSLKYYPRLLDLIDFYCGKGPRPEWLGNK